MLPREGEVSVDGVQVGRLSETARRNFRIQRIGFVFQDFRLLQYLSVLDNILLPFRINKTLSITPVVKSRAIEIAEALQIRDKLTRFPASLSHGERQRVAIGRALLNRPVLLLADEPTGNLDPANKKRILTVLCQYVDTYGCTLVTVTHDHQLLHNFDAVVDFTHLSGV
jgi:ABC-type lipoprotein export system ATPase subunit